MSLLFFVIVNELLKSYISFVRINWKWLVDIELKMYKKTIIIVTYSSPTKSKRAWEIFHDKEKIWRK